MILPAPIKTDLNEKQFIETIDKKYTFLAEGGYAIVYLDDATDTVIKVGSVNRDHYLQFVSRVGINSANVHLPKIYSVKIFDTDPESPDTNPYYMVRMERLTPTYDLNYLLKTRLDIDYGGASEKTDHYFLDRGMPYLANSFAACNIGETIPWTSDLLEVRDILLELYNTGSISDLHHNNIMWRYDSEQEVNFDAVFTDPVV
jgi:hypothetical protein